MNTPVAFSVDEEARWREIQRLSDAIVQKDEPPTELESALCGAVWRARLVQKSDAHAELLAIHEAVMNPEKVKTLPSDTYTVARVKEFIQRAVAATKEQEPAVPEGWKLVPVEPTENMIDGARGFRVNLHFGAGGISGPVSAWEAKEIYQRMLAAAPESGKGEG